MKTAAGFALGVLALALTARPATAQSPASHYSHNNYELNLHAGALILDDDFAASLGEADDTDVLLGARFLYNTAPGWGFGANFDWIPAASIDLRETDEDLDVNLFLYSAEVDYTFPSPTGSTSSWVGASARPRSRSATSRKGSRTIARPTSLCRWPPA
jgi:hypothetical protein